AWLVSIVPTTARAAPLPVYDGFTAGGATPNTTAGEYQTGTGFPGDSLIGQGPTISGFLQTFPSDWRAAPANFFPNVSFPSFAYPRVEANQFTYIDAGNRMLNTSFGQVNLFRGAGADTTT